MIDIVTVFICIMHTTLFFAVAYFVFWLNQKTYKGFGLWTLATVCNLLLYAAVLLRLSTGEWMGVVSVGGVALFMPLSSLLRADAILRFTKDKKLPSYVYFALLVVIPINLYFYYTNSIAMRYTTLMLLVIPFNYIICKALFSYKPLTSKLLYVGGGVFFLMRIVGLAFEAVVLFVHPEYSSIFQSPDMGSYLLFTLVAEVGIGFLFFMIHTQRAQEELLKTNALLENVSKIKETN